MTSLSTVVKSLSSPWELRMKVWCLWSLWVWKEKAQAEVFCTTGEGIDAKITIQEVFWSFFLTNNEQQTAIFRNNVIWEVRGVRFIESQNPSSVWWFCDFLATFLRLSCPVTQLSHVSRQVGLHCWETTWTLRRKITSMLASCTSQLSEYSSFQMP